MNFASASKDLFKSNQEFLESIMAMDSDSNSNQGPQTEEQVKERIKEMAVANLNQVVFKENFLLDTLLSVQHFYTSFMHVCVKDRGNLNEILNLCLDKIETASKEENGQQILSFISHQLREMIRADTSVRTENAAQISARTERFKTSLAQLDIPIKNITQFAVDWQSYALRTSFKENVPKEIQAMHNLILKEAALLNSDLGLVGLIKEYCQVMKGKNKPNQVKTLPRLLPFMRALLIDGANSVVTPLTWRKKLRALVARESGVFYNPVSSILNRFRSPEQSGRVRMMSSLKDFRMLFESLKDSTLSQAVRQELIKNLTTALNEVADAIKHVPVETSKQRLELARFYVDLQSEINRHVNTKNTTILSKLFEAVSAKVNDPSLLQKMQANKEAAVNASTVGGLKILNHYCMLKENGNKSTKMISLIEILLVDGVLGVSSAAKQKNALTNLRSVFPSDFNTVLNKASPEQFIQSMVYMRNAIGTKDHPLHVKALHEVGYTLSLITKTLASIPCKTAEDRKKLENLMRKIENNLQKIPNLPAGTLSQIKDLKSAVTLQIQQSVEAEKASGYNNGFLFFKRPSAVRGVEATLSRPEERIAGKA